MTAVVTRSPANTPERYLWQKPHARHLWFRMAVPRRYQGVEPRKIIQRSLGTSDRRQASVAAGELRANLHREWEDRLSPSVRAETLERETGAERVSPSDADLVAAAAEAAFTKVLPKLDALLSSKAPETNADYKALLDSLEGHRLRLLRTRQSDGIHLWKNLADRCIERKGWSLPHGSEEYEHFVGMLAEAGLDALRVGRHRHAGEFNTQPSSSVVVDGLKIEKEAADRGETGIELFERYAAQRAAEKRKRTDTINQDRKIVRQFAAFVGERRSVRSIKPSDVRDWRDTVAALPPNYRKMKAYAGLTMRQAAEKAKTTGARGLSPTTINKYLSTISPLFGWCRTNGYADHNPCDGLFYDIPKGRNPRPPFTDEQLRKIFASPLFTGFLRDGREHQPGNVRSDDWRYWIPVICLFTGARIGEIAQLRVGDVRQEHGIWCIHIRADEATGQNTKSGFSRTAPVHSKLQGIGFLSFVERQRERARSDGNEQLFHELKPNERGQIGATPSRFWRTYLEKIGIKDGGDGFGAHSFRHTLADQLRLAGYLDDEIEVALGHNQKTVTSGYGKVRQGTVQRLSGMFEGVTFEAIAITR